MLNAYMGYRLVRSELTKAIDYSNIMESAHSILRIADNDLKTFEIWFDSMARFVHKIGIDTNFTAVEIAGAVKYLSMAGMNIEINKSILPITNLALIGDNDVSYIADLATNIMAGYDINIAAATLLSGGILNAGNMFGYISNTTQLALGMGLAELHDGQVHYFSKHHDLLKRAVIQIVVQKAYGMLRSYPRYLEYWEQRVRDKYLETQSQSSLANNTGQYYQRISE